MPKPLACAHCGKEFPRVPGAGLYCGTDCATARAQKYAESAEKLMQLGFSQVGESNIWSSKGVSVTLDGVLVHGLDQTVVLHSQAVSGL